MLDKKIAVIVGSGFLSSQNVVRIIFYTVTILSLLGAGIGLVTHFDEEFA